MKFATRVVHAGPPVDPVGGDIVPPIHLSTTFGRNAEGEPLSDHTYIRESNPNQVFLEEAVADLEGGATALAFASGMAAGVGVLQVLKPGDHVVMPDDVYYGFAVAAREFCSKWGIESDFVAMDDADGPRPGAPGQHEAGLGRDAVKPVNEDRRSSSRPLVAARRVGARVLVDNTFATPVLQRPIEVGADIVLHSATKYFGGHSDVAGRLSRLPESRRTPFGNRARPTHSRCRHLARSTPGLCCVASGPSLAACLCKARTR